MSLFAHRAGKWDPIKSFHLRPIWRCIVMPGVKWHTWSCPLVIASPKTHVNARCQQALSHFVKKSYNHSLCILWPAGGAAASVPTTGWVAAHLCQLDLEGRGVEGIPGGEDEREGRGTGCLASHQTRRSPHTGTGAGEIYRWMDQ